jgi:hypothetical protein
MLLTDEQIGLFRQSILNKHIEVLFLDLETSPAQFWGWGTGEQYVDANMLVTGTETKVITAQYKRALIDKEASYFVWDYKKGKGDDSEVVQNITEIINKADIVIGQNIKAFDIKVLQERAKVLRLPPINVDFMMDTLTSSRSSFKSMSHRLDYRSKQYGLGGKIKMQMSDWVDILEGRTKPEDKMVPYGLKDCIDNEVLFWNDLPYLNLPKATINKILKLIVGMTERKVEIERRLFCKHCALKRQRKFDVVVRDGQINCNNCGEVSDAAP